MIILDTNILSELMRPSPEARVLVWMDGLHRSDIGITAISVAEILYGIGSLPDGKKKRRLFEAATTVFDEHFVDRIFAFDHFAAVEYADIVCQRDKLGTPISAADAQIAGICRFYSAGFATRNTKDFENTGLLLINPWEA
jgi:toxin FitB